MLDPSRFGELTLAGEGSGRVSVPPVVMVWPCPLSVEKYVAAGAWCRGSASVVSAVFVADGFLVRV